MDETSADPRLGAVLEGRYRVTQRLAEGAMGVVYRAERVRLGRPVAIKFLRASFAGDPQFLQRFEREARAMSRLGHPHCVSVIDFGVADAPYVVMEYVTGTTLSSLLERGRLPIGRAISIARQVLAGLAHAHGQGIIHRDIKPANIMLTEATGTGDHVRILDFGLAKLRDHAPGDISTNQLVVGTPSYMSPEQSLGEHVDARTDVYSTGILLFELLTGQKPFRSDETYELLRMHREDVAPRLREVCSEVRFSRELEAVMARALAKTPGERFETAMDFAAALDEVPEAHRLQTALSMLDEELPYAATQAHDAVAPPRPRRRIPAAVAALLVVACAGGGALFAWNQQTERVEAAGARAALTPPPSSQTAADVVGVDEATAPGSNEPMRFEPDILEPIDAADHDAADDADPDAAADDELGEAEPPSPDDLADLLGTGETEEGIPDDDDGAGEETLPEDEREEPVAAVAEEEGEPHVEDTPAEALEAEAEPTPRPVRTVRDAVALIEQGQREAAIRGLQRLRREQPKSAYIPYLLGNLYFEKKWWTDGIENYRLAIKNNRVYRKKSILNKNLIRALSSEKTKGKAIYTIKNFVGQSALPHLRHAAKHDKNPKVRSRAKWLTSELTKKSKRRR